MYQKVAHLQHHECCRLHRDSLLDFHQIRGQKNKIIRYKGRLYSRSESDDTFQISIYNNGKWEETTDIELPDYE